MIGDSELISGCRKYNESAQRALFYKYAPIMKAICIRYVSSQEDVKDIVQESFIKVFSNINSFSGTGSFEGWIKRIVINTAISHYKKNKKHLHNSIDSDTINDLSEEENWEEDDSNSLPMHEFSETQLLDSLNSIGEPFRIVFNLFYIEELSHKEISEMLGIDYKTSRTRLFRAKKLIRENLAKSLGKREKIIF